MKFESLKTIRSNRLEVILKVAARCNINCTYCYFFNGADDTFMQRPALVSTDTIEAISRFLVNGVHSLNIESVKIIFHGGEPLLLGKRRFDEMCAYFSTHLGSITDLTFCVQTNAMLIDDDWVNIFVRHHIRISISLDGPREYHDKERLDFSNQGTYDQVIRGIEFLRQASHIGRIDGFGALCVINPVHSSKKIYRHFVDTLGIHAIDFLLPDVTHDGFHGSPSTYGDYLCELFDVWTHDDNPNIQVRVLNSVLSLLLGGPSMVQGYGLELAHAITIESDGTVCPDDLLRACGPQMMNSSMNVANTELKEFFDSPRIQQLDQDHLDFDDSCQDCCWLKVCGGGLMVNRFKKDVGFRNPSIFCDGLKMFYAHIATYLLEKGLPLKHLKEVLIESAQRENVLRPA
ncbi:MAG: radical SAM protein [Thaumarchaeota archaeon]|nr:radical SAM protein [Nitrososphaerota archaeon]